jgi:hypothetical protein
MRETIKLHDLMVFVARGYIPLVSFDTATEKGRRRLGTQTPNCEKSRATLKQTAYTKIETGDGNNRMATTVGTNGVEPQPSIPR